MLATTANMLNPSLIVSRAASHGAATCCWPPIRETVYRRSLPLATRDLQVRASSLGSLAGVIGASSMVAGPAVRARDLRALGGAGSPAGMPEVVQAATG